MTVSRSQPSRPTLDSLQAQIEELKLRVAKLEWQERKRRLEEGSGRVAIQRTDSMTRTTAMDEMTKALKLAVDVLRVVQKTYNIPDSPIIKLTIDDCEKALAAQPAAPVMGFFDPDKKYTNHLSVLIDAVGHDNMMKVKTALNIAGYTIYFGNPDAAPPPSTQKVREDLEEISISELSRDWVASRKMTIEECAKVKVMLLGLGSRSDEYLKGFEDACRAYIDAIKALSTNPGEQE